MDYIIVKKATGFIRAPGKANPDTAARQAGEDEWMLPVLETDLFTIKVDSEYGQIPAMAVKMEAIRGPVKDVIDRDAGVALSPFYSNVEGQDQRYFFKRAEAMAWTEGDDVAHPEKYPWMIDEAEVGGITVAQVRASIMAQVAHEPLIRRLESTRVTAKRNVDAAANSFDAVKAANVDWQAIIDQFAEGQG